MLKRVVTNLIYMKKSFTLYPENLDTSNSIPTPEDFLGDKRLNMSKSSQDGPSEMVLQNLFNYAKALSVNKTKNAGTVNIVLN